MAKRLYDYIRTLNGVSPSGFFSSILALRRHQERGATQLAPRHLPGIAVPLHLHSRTIREASYFAAHAAAAFGSYGSSFFHLQDPRPYFGPRALSLWERLTPLLRAEENAYASMAGLPTRDAVLMRGGGGGGFFAEPRWFLSVDETARAVVLSIRGTMSIADAVTDALCTNEAFAWGVAHAGAAEGVRAIWGKAKPIVECELAARPPDWRFICTGHSLGGAVALLVVVLATYEAESAGGGWLLGGRHVEAIAFAPPPVYSGPPLPPHIRLTTWVHEWDAVSRLSLTSVRELGRVCHALAEATPWNARMMAGSGVLTSEELSCIGAAEPNWVRTWAPDETPPPTPTSVSLLASESTTTTPTPTPTPTPTSAITSTPLYIPGDIFSWREPSLESGSVPASGAAELAAAEAAAESADFGEESSSPLSPLTALAETFSFISRAESLSARLIDGLRSAHALAVTSVRGPRPSVTTTVTAIGISFDSSPAPLPPLTTRKRRGSGPLLTRNRHDDGEMTSIPLFSLRSHIPDRYLFGLRALAVHAEAIDTASVGTAAAATTDRQASAVSGSAKMEGGSGGDVNI